MDLATLKEGRIPSRLPRQRPPLILLASDREPAAGEVERALSSHGYTIFRAHTGRIALEAARTAQPTLVIVDVMLPEADPLGLCRALRDDPEVGARVPLLVITTSPPAPADHRVAIRAGVWEFLPDGAPAAELNGKVDAYVLATMRRERDPAAALTDETGLYTGEGLTHRARELALQAYHHDAGFACVVMSPADARDAACVAARLKAAGRRSDAIGRVGPAEFAIVAPGTDARHAVMLAERLAREIRGAQPGPVKLHAGYDAVPSLRRAPLEPRSLLEHATRALARARNGEASAGGWIRGFEGEK
jgi:PleD family two-component response regulator